MDPRMLAKQLRQLAKRLSTHRVKWEDAVIGLEKAVLRNQDRVKHTQHTRHTQQTQKNWRTSNGRRGVLQGGSSALKGGARWAWAAYVFAAALGRALPPLADDTSILTQIDMPSDSVALPASFASSAPSASRAVAVGMVTIVPSEVQVLPLGYRSARTGYGHVDETAAVAAAVKLRARKNDKSIVIAVIDSGAGVDDNIPGRVWRNPGEIPGDGVDNDNNGYTDDVHGWNFVSMNNNVTDDDSESHGTHVAGIVNGLSDTVDIGMAFEGSVMVVKVFDGVGTAHRSQKYHNDFDNQKLADAIRYAVGNGADVINLSMRVDARTLSLPVADALQYAENNNVVVIVAAGNQHATDPTPLARFATVMAVGSTDASRYESDFSNWAGKESNYVLAHGQDVESTVVDKVRGAPRWRLSGTSMSAPAVARIVAIMLERAELTPVELRHTLMATAAQKNQRPPSLHNEHLTNAELVKNLQDEYSWTREKAKQFVLKMQCDRLLDARENKACLEYNDSSLTGGFASLAAPRPQPPSPSLSLLSELSLEAFSRFALGMCHMVAHAAVHVLNTAARNVARKSARRNGARR